MEEGGVKCAGKFDEFSAREASQGEALDAAEDGGGVAAERVSSLAELFASSSEIDILLRFESSSSALWTCVKSSNQKRPKRKVREVLVCHYCISCGRHALAHTCP
jgi:hypothetical protein